MTVRQSGFGSISDVEEEVDIDNDNDDNTPNTELKEDDNSTKSTEANMFSANAIDDTVNTVDATDALQDILLRHRKPFKRTILYKQMTETGSQQRGSTFMKSIFTHSGKKGKSPAGSSGQDSMRLSGINALLENEELDDNDAANQPLKGGARSASGSRSGSASDEDNAGTAEMQPVNSETVTPTPSHKREKSDSLRFNTSGNLEYLRKKWKFPKCNGCGRVIPIVFEGKDKVTKQVITYDCKFVEDLDETRSSLVYFHDKHCENLRKYKESIRKYVLESQIQRPSQARNNMKNYVKNLLNHKDLLINIHSGELPRPGM